MQHGTVALMAKKNYIEAARSMPSKIEQVYDQPKVFEVIRAIGEQSVIAQIEFLLIQLASYMSVGGNLNKSQVPFIAKQLVELYPQESVADFNICFQKGAMGQYGEIQRLDGITLRSWLNAYLEEKYRLLEEKLAREKENLHKPLTPTGNTEWLEKWAEQVEGVDGKKIRPITEKEIKEEGGHEPKKKEYRRPDDQYVLEHREKTRVARIIAMKQRYPEKSEEEIIDIVNSMPV